jgi:AraC-like DNA-binding protein
MADEIVRIWRPTTADAALFMEGQTTAYAVDPRDEYVFGIVTGRPMLARRGNTRHLVVPGQAVAWDPTRRHTGRALDGRPWDARLMIIDAAELNRLAGDHDDDRPLSEVLFPDPVIRDPRLTAAFHRLHRTASMSTRLEHDELLSSWLRAVINHQSASPAPAPAPAPTATPHDDRALGIALDYLASHYQQNIGLDELASVAGIGKFRLVRLFRRQIGVSPHALHIAHRIRAARRLLESGYPIAHTAATTGFSDQSHLHRHFTRTLGITPGEYQRRLR